MGTCEKNKLTINIDQPNTSSIVVFPLLIDMDFTLNNETLKVVKQFNYLGVVIDCHLSVIQHLRKVISMVQARLL